MNGELLERATELRRQGQAFVLATVVRSQRPASARPGDAALLVAGGQLEGWVGGGCVQSCIEREAQQALRDGSPRLVRLSPEPRDEEGIVSYPMTCHSGGTLEIYLEPVVPAPQLLVVGDSPVARALASLAGPLGFRLTDNVRPGAWVVVAHQSEEDEPALRGALEGGAAYVALVASRRRSEAIVDQLRAEGLADEALARLKAPAGLDIGAQTGAEIAVSILAEMIQRRRRGAPSQDVAQPVEEATDPVCGMRVQLATARWTANKDRVVYAFCSPGCRRAFLTT